jgi:hypothetical protein
VVSQPGAGPYTTASHMEHPPGGMPAAVPEAGLITHQCLAGAELVLVWAAGRWAGDPRACRRADEIADVRFHCWRAVSDYPLDFGVVRRRAYARELIFDALNRVDLGYFERDLNPRRE